LPVIGREDAVARRDDDVADGTMLIDTSWGLSKLAFGKPTHASRSIMKKLKSPFVTTAEQSRLRKILLPKIA
jgi:hypothetical protein